MTILIILLISVQKTVNCHGTDIKDKYMLSIKEASDYFGNRHQADETAGREPPQ